MHMAKQTSDPRRHPCESRDPCIRRLVRRILCGANAAEWIAGQARDDAGGSAQAAPCPALKKKDRRKPPTPQPVSPGPSGAAAGASGSGVAATIGGRDPKIAPPTRTCVAPKAIAVS